MCTAGDLASELCTVHARETARSAGSRLAGRAGGAVIRIVTHPTRGGPSLTHLPLGVDAEPLGAHPVPGEEATGVDGDAGDQARDEQLGRGRPDVGAADVGRLVDHDLVAAQRDRKAVAPGRRHPHGLHQMNSSWAPSVMSMKSVALMIASTPS